MKLKLQINICYFKKLTGLKLVIVVLIYGFLCPLLFKDSNIAKMFYDVLFLFMLFFLLKKGKFEIKKRTICTGKIQVIFAVLYMAVCIISAVINFVPVIQIWWNMRISFSIFAFWFLCLKYVDFQCVEKAKAIFLKLAHLNFCLSIIEFIIGYRQDNLGGIFGVFVGTNSLLNVFLIIVTAISVEKAYEFRKEMKSFVIILAENCLIAAMAELKAYYLEVVLIFVLVLIFNKPSIKSIVIILLGVSVLYVGVSALYYYNPYYANSLNFDGILTSFDLAYSDNAGLSRGRAYPYILSNILITPIEYWLGLGYGNITASSVPSLSSDFYVKYGYLRYNWFCHAYKLIETGWLGVLSFMGFWLAPLFNFHSEGTIENRVIAKTIAVCTVFLFVYNTSLMNLYTIFVLVFFCTISVIKE